MDLELWQYNAVCLGAQDKRKDELALQVQGAFYTAYWNNDKKAKSLEYILNRIYSKKRDRAISKEKPDVELFERRARRLSDGG